MNLRPLQNRIVVQQIDESVTAGGIVIPDVAKDTPMQGIVIATGCDVELLDVGDNVVFPKFTWTRVAIDGKSYLVMKESDVLAILE